MTFEDFDSKINEFITNQDNLDILDNIKEELKTHFTDYEETKQKEAQLEAKVAELRDTNLKLYTKQTLKVETPKETKEDAPQVDAFTKFKEEYSKFL